MSVVDLFWCEVNRWTLNFWEICFRRMDIRLRSLTNMLPINMKLSLQFRCTYISLAVLFKFIHFHFDYLQHFQITITRSARRPNKLVFQSHRLFFSLPAQNWGSMELSSAPVNFNNLPHWISVSSPSPSSQIFIYYCRHLLLYITLIGFPIFSLLITHSTFLWLEETPLTGLRLWGILI